MNARQRQILTRFNQILAFLDANAGTIPATLVAKQRQTLASAVAQITGFTQAQLVKGADAPASQSVASARATLRNTYLRQLSTIGLHGLTGQNAGDPAARRRPPPRVAAYRRRRREWDDGVTECSFRRYVRPA